MENKLKIFQNENFGEIRAISIDNEPYFVAKDVMEMFKATNRNRMMQDLDDDEKGYTQINTPGGNQKMAIVNESGLYSLLFAMTPTKARGVSDEYIEERTKQLKSFKRWVTHEVIPSIRKNGGYIVGQEELSDDELLSRALMVANKKIEEKNNKINELECESKQKSNVIGVLKPKADYYDSILQNKSTLTVTSIAKDYGMSAIEFNQLLHSLDIQYKQSQQWFLYKNYQGYGYVHSKTTKYTHKDGTEGISQNTEWTQKGRLFLYETLKKYNIVPLIERN